MYEQPKTSIVGRVVWFIISLLIIAGIVWLILWFFFWREPSVGTTKTPIDKGQSTQQSGNTPSKSNGASSSSTKTPSTTSSAPTSLGQVVEETSNTTNSAATGTLVNTGPGDVITPIVITVVGGVAFYQFRLRRKFVSEIE